MTKDLYQVLGVDRTATRETIRRAYKRLARKHHPDINPGDAAAEAKFKEIRRASDILTDPEKRSLYDRYGSAAFSGGGAPGPAGPPGAAPFGAGAGFGDLFEMFQQRTARPRRGRDLEMKVSISFAQAVEGTTIVLPVRRASACPECSGRASRSCPSCRGTGQVIDTERTRVKIPEGIDAGAKVRLAGKGESRGGPPGDLLVVVSVEPHPYFERNGDEIYSEVPVTFSEAYLGAEIEIPTIRGPVRARIPPGTSGGQKFRLRGRGARNVRTKAPGDHVYRITIAVPSAASEAGRQIAEQIDMLYGGPVRADLPRKLE